MRPCVSGPGTLPQRMQDHRLAGALHLAPGRRPRRPRHALLLVAVRAPTQQPSLLMTPQRPTRPWCVRPTILHWILLNTLSRPSPPAHAPIARSLMGSTVHAYSAYPLRGFNCGSALRPCVLRLEPGLQALTRQFLLVLGVDGVRSISAVTIPRAGIKVVRWCQPIWAMLEPFVAMKCEVWVLVCVVEQGTLFPLGGQFTPSTRVEGSSRKNTNLLGGGGYVVVGRESGSDLSMKSCSMSRFMHDFSVAPYLHLLE